MWLACSSGSALAPATSGSGDGGAQAKTLSLQLEQPMGLPLVPCHWCPATGAPPPPVPQHLLRVLLGGQPGLLTQVPGRVG